MTTPGRRIRAAVLAGLTALLGSGVPAQGAAGCPPAAHLPTAQQHQTAAPNARDRGLLWRATKDGRSAYLYGTLHVGRPEWTVPGPRVRAALQASDTLALEVDLGDPEMQRRVATAVAALARTAALPEALNARIERLAAAACLPAGSLAAQHPMLQAVTLALLEARRAGLDPAFGQESALARLARASQRGVVSLESPEQQLRALLPDEALPLAEPLAQMLDQLEDGRARQTLERLAAAWEAGRMAELESYETWCDCVADAVDRARLARLNDERNPGLAEAIDALHARGRRVFAAVGALHMTGGQSLLRLLGQRGYRIERVPFAP